MKKEISLICFDLDGTLADTSEGIYTSYLYTCNQLEIAGDDVMSQLNGVIGSKPIDVFQERWGLDRKTAETAVGIYRDYYEKDGIYQAYIYPGIEEILGLLQEKEYILAVTTLKYEPFAKKMLEHLGIARYFAGIYGCGADNLDTKGTLIQKAMTNFQKCNTQTILVGDSKVDAYGAKAAGVEFLGVTYGLGFSSAEEVSFFCPSGIVKKPADLKSHFLGSAPLY